MKESREKFIQGDVIFTRINKLPENLKQLEGKILQASEVTGNFHQFTSTSKVDIYAHQDAIARNKNINTITPDEGKYVVVNGMATLFHGKENALYPNPVARGVADHEAFQLPAGIFKISIVREWDYENEVSARVQD